eukprot:9487497-Lingulodinium_polyedra.AAC.1
MCLGAAAWRRDGAAGQAVPATRTEGGNRFLCAVATACPSRSNMSTIRAGLANLQQSPSMAMVARKQLRIAS